MNWQKYLGLAVILLALYGAGVGTGAALWYGHVQGQVAEVQEQARGASDTVLPDLADKLVQLERDKAQLEEELRNVSNHPDCDLTRGDVGVLNRARTGLPDAPALADAEKHAASTHTQRAEIQAHADCGLRYRDLAAQHDALIDWLALSGRK